MQGYELQVAWWVYSISFEWSYHLHYHSALCSIRPQSFPLSTDQPLPPNILPSAFAEDVDDEDLLEAAMQVEAQSLDFSDVDEDDLLHAVEDAESTAAADAL